MNTRTKIEEQLLRDSRRLSRGARRRDVICQVAEGYRSPGEAERVKKHEVGRNG